jgi:DNA-binding PadR family transcriptional regulator
MSSLNLNPTAASLLGFLHERPLSGWDLAQVVERSIGYFWNVTRSQIYRELRTLERAGLVAVGEPGPRDKRVFTITRAGRAAFAQWIEQEPALELIRFPLLLTVFFGRHLEPARLQRFLTAHRVRHESRLEHYRTVVGALAQSDPFAAATCRFGIAYEEAALRWFDTLRLPKAAARGKR